MWSPSVGRAWLPVGAFLTAADADTVARADRPRALARAIRKESPMAPARPVSAAALLGRGDRRGRAPTLARIGGPVGLAECERFPEERGA